MPTEETGKLSINNTGILDIHMEKIKLAPYHILHMKINFRWVKNLKEKGKTVLGKVFITSK